MNEKNNHQKLPPVALGTWAWGTGFNGGRFIFGQKTTRDQLYDVYKEAVRNHLTLWDTAPAYGLGTCEKLLGEFTADHKDIQISTKFLPIGRRSNLRKSFEKSRVRLSRDIIDIFWIHTPYNVKKWTAELIPLLQNTGVKMVGVSNHNLEQIKEARAILEKAGFQLNAVQNHYSLLYRPESAMAVLKYCQEENILFFSYMILEQGALTGTYTEDNPFPRLSRRGFAYPPKILKQLAPLYEYITNLATLYQVSNTAVLIAWAISRNTIPIVGVTKEKHISSIVQGIELSLSEDTFLELEQIMEGQNIIKKGIWEQ